MVQSEGIQELGQKLPGRDAVFPLDLNMEAMSLELPGTSVWGGPVPEGSKMERGQVLMISLEALGFT